MSKALNRCFGVAINVGLASALALLLLVRFTSIDLEYVLRVNFGNDLGLIAYDALVEVSYNDLTYGITLISVVIAITIVFSISLCKAVANSKDYPEEYFTEVRLR